jgi:hypothetical protein
MRVLLLILYSISLHLPDLFGQQLEVFGGPTSIKYYQPQHGGRTTFRQNPTVSFHVAINDVMVMEMPFSIQVSWTTGACLQNNASGSQAGNSSSETQTIWSDLGLGLYPLNLTIARHLHIDLGGEIAFLIFEESHTTGSWWTMQDPLTTHYYQKKSTEKEAVYFGAIGRISLPLTIKPNFSMAPQYLCFLGLSSEFMPKTKTFRQTLSVAFLVDLL